MAWQFGDDWGRRSACRSEQPATYFGGERGGAPNLSKAMCDGCPVRRECLQFALESPWEPYGIWGGLAQREVQRMWARTHTDDSGDLAASHVGLVAS